VNGEGTPIPPRERSISQRDSPKEDIDLSDFPEIPPEAFAQAIIRKDLQPVVRKAQITLRINA
jgi:hypothetical protein